MEMNLKQCRDHCEKLANDIRNIANNTTDQRSREMLTLGKCVFITVIKL